jgi:hypothetical protein
MKNTPNLHPSLGPAIDEAFERHNPSTTIANPLESVLEKEEKFITNEEEYPILGELLESIENYRHQIYELGNQDEIRTFELLNLLTEKSEVINRYFTELADIADRKIKSNTELIYNIIEKMAKGSRQVIEEALPDGKQIYQKAARDIHRIDIDNVIGTFRRRLRDFVPNDDINSALALMILDKAILTSVKNGPELAIAILEKIPEASAQVLSREIMDTSLISYLNLMALDDEKFPELAFELLEYSSDARKKEIRNIFNSLVSRKIQEADSHTAANGLVKVKSLPVDKYSDFLLEQFHPHIFLVAQRNWDSGNYTLAKSVIEKNIPGQTATVMKKALIQS